MDARGAVALLTLLENRPDLVDQGLISGCTSRSIWGRAAPGMKPAPRNIQDMAQQTNCVIVGMGSDERELDLAPGSRTRGMFD